MIRYSTDTPLRPMWTGPGIPVCLVVPFGDARGRIASGIAGAGGGGGAP